MINLNGKHGEKNLLLIVVLLFSHTIHAQNINEAGFAQICQIYTAALDTNMNIEQMSGYIFSNVAQRVKSKDALDAHESVMQLKALQRYKIFKKTAVMSLKHNWDCPAMKKVMAMKKAGG